jgi:hypothetical protein
VALSAVSGSSERHPEKQAGGHIDTSGGILSSMLKYKDLVDGFELLASGVVFRRTRSEEGEGVQRDTINPSRFSPLFSG